MKATYTEFRLPGNLQVSPRSIGVPTALRAELTLLKVRHGRKIVVELKPEVPFEIVPGSEGDGVKIASVLPALTPAKSFRTSRSFGLVDRLPR